MKRGKSALSGVDDANCAAFRRGLRSRMRELGITQGDLAVRMGTSRSYVSVTVNGKVSITFAAAVRFAKALGLGFRPSLVNPATGKEYGRAEPPCRA